MTVDQRGAGRPTLVLHGGGGPGTVEPISASLAPTMRVLTPTHPGWNGAPRPPAIDGVPALARAYLDLLAREGLRDVFVVGSSIGGWLGAEMAVADEAGLVGALVLVDSMGIEVESEPMTDFFALSPREVAEKSFHDSDRFYVDPESLTSEQVETQAANMATMKAVAGDPYMHDPELEPKLSGVEIPTLVIWGQDDQIVTPAYGRVFAARIPNARFELVTAAGHLPQIERPEATLALIGEFAAAHAG